MVNPSLVLAVGEDGSMDGEVWLLLLLLYLFFTTHGVYKLLPSSFTILVAVSRGHFRLPWWTQSVEPPPFFNRRYSPQRYGVYDHRIQLYTNYRMMEWLCFLKRIQCRLIKPKYETSSFVRFQFMVVNFTPLYNVIYWKTTKKWVIFQWQRSQCHLFSRIVELPKCS